MDVKRLHSSCVFGLLLLCGSAYAGPNCLSVSSEYYKYSKLHSMVEAKGWKIKSADDKKGCVATHSAAFSIADRVAFENGYSGYFGASSLANLSASEGPTIATVTGPDREYVLNTLFERVVNRLPR